ncbi:MAG: ABC transporter permease [Bacillota bacterium]
MKINRNTILKALLNYGIYLFLLLICLVLTFTTDSFLTMTNITNVFLQTSIIATMAIGVTFVLITGNNDLSMGSVMAISSAVGIGMIKVLELPWWLGMSAIMLVSVFFGIVNGALVAFLDIPAFLVTLSTQFIGRGLTLVVSGGTSWYNLPAAFGAIASGRVLGMPVIIITVFLLYVFFHIRLKYTIFGRRVYAVGSNRESARISGINVKRTIIFAYIQCGLLVGIASILQTARMDSFWAAMGTGLEFQAIAGSIIGGTSMKGGIGNLLGTFAGVLLMGVINNALNLYGVDANWQEAARGFVILLAIIVDAVRQRYNVVE